MASLKRQLDESEKKKVLAQQRRKEVLYCFAEDHPIDDETEVEFHHIKPFSEEGPTETSNIGAVCKEHHRRIRTLSLSEFRDQIALSRFFDHTEPRRLDDLLAFKLARERFGRKVSVNTENENQLTLHFIDPERAPQLCPVLTCPATGMRFFYCSVPIEYIANDNELQPRPLEQKACLGVVSTLNGSHAVSACNL